MNPRQRIFYYLLHCRAKAIAVRRLKHLDRVGFLDSAEHIASCELTIYSEMSAMMQLLKEGWE
jgi:hypothetical protein